MDRRVVKCFLAGVCLAASAAAQPAFQVADVNTTQTGGTDAWPYQTQFVEAGGAIYFSVSDGRHGMELWRSDGTAVGTHMVRDICPGVCNAHPLFLTPVGSRIFFAADDGVHGTELWVSDGTAAGTAMVADLAPGATASNPSELREMGGNLLFAANNTAMGDGELWISDGTAAGTSVLVEIQPGPVPSNPLFLGRLGSFYLFSAYTTAEGRELWRTDGTAAGTSLVANINAGSMDSLFDQPPYPGLSYAAVSGGRLFFAAIDGTHGEELWISDGTPAGTQMVKDIDTDALSYGSSPYLLTPFGAGIVFRAGEAAHGQELWTSDGTEGGTVLLKDVNPGTTSSGLFEMAAAGSRAYFRANDGVHGYELWATDGTEAGTALVRDIRPGSDSGLWPPWVPSFASLGTSLVFFADDGVHGSEPWISDGSQAGTVLLADVEPGSGPSSPFIISDRTLVTGGHWYFRAFTAADGIEPWVSDGKPAGTHKLAEVNDQTSAFFVFFAQLYGPRSIAGNGDGSVYFQGDDGISGPELWKSDGTAGGTSSLGDLRPGPFGSYPYELTPFGGSVLFNADDGTHGAELWKSDGTPGGTALLKDLDPALSYSNGSPQRLTPLGGLVLFAGPEEDLWRTDGTAGGTVPVAAGVKLGDDRAILGSQLLFVRGTATGGALWKTDGTAPGTVLVRDFPTGPPVISAPSLLTRAGSRVFFAAPTAAEGRELWVTDGTGAGTSLVKDIVPGPGSALPLTYGQGLGGSFMEPLGSSAVFVADDETHGREPWVSDGTPGGTVLLADVCPGACSSEPEFRTAGGKAFFVADDGVHGRELWATDGTPAGTSLALDIEPGAGSSLPQGLTAIGRVLLFSAWDTDNGRELWLSDGTPAGTARVQDIAPGELSSSPLQPTASGPRVYFAANDNTHGFELWAVPRNALGSALSATKTVAGGAFEGGTVTYTIAATNNGRTLQPDAPGAEVTDVLPAGLALAGASATSGSVATDVPSRTVTWNGSIPAGGSVTITIQAVVQAGTLGSSLSNQATLAWDADADGINEASGLSDDPGAAGGSDPTSITIGPVVLDYYTLVPCRVADTRTTTALASGVSRTFAVAGSCGIPAGAKAVAANLTVVGATGSGYLVVWPSGTAMPGTSSLNFLPAFARANNAVLGLGGGGVDARAVVNGGGSAQLVIDVNGYFQ